MFITVGPMKKLGAGGDRGKREDMCLRTLLAAACALESGLSPHTIERRGGRGGCEQGGWRGGERRARRKSK